MKKQLKQNGKNTSKTKAQKETELEDAFNKAIAAPKKDAKVRVNTWIDLDIYEALNREAEQSGKKYQTLLNQYLRAAVLKEVSLTDLKSLIIGLEKHFKI